MKSSLGIAAVACAALLCGFAFQSPPPAQDPLPTRVEKLEKDLAASRLRVEALTAEVAEMKKLVSSTVEYLQSQSKNAAEMAAVLDESEKAGFTYGINPDSRHVLLRGWREQLAGAQKDVPQVEAPPEPPPPPRPGTRPAPKPTEKSGT